MKSPAKIIQSLDRRQLLASLCVLPFGPALVAPVDSVSAPPRTYKLLLNSGFSGPHAWFFLAQERGYLREAGIEIDFTAGDGAAAIVPRIVKEGYDIGYGDMNALIEEVARHPEDAPIAIYTTFNTPPFTIAVAADGPIKTPADLEGRQLGSHPQDAALKTFPAFAKLAHIDASKVEILRSSASMRSLVEAMLAGKTAGVFGFVNTIIAAVAPADIDVKAKLRFIEYRDYCPDLYGNTLMVTRKFARENPTVVAALVRAFNRGLSETLKDLDAAVAAVARHDAKVRLEVDKPRLEGTLRVEMAHPEGKRLGIGDVDDKRLQRAIALLAETNQLPRVPAVREVFTRDFLPPAAERVKTLARPARRRMLLNSGYSGAQAWFFLAQDNGHLQKEGIELAFTTGLGAYTAAPRMLAERFDIGYGDINALIEVVAQQKALEDTPIAVYMMFNAPPSTIVVAADGPLKTPQDLAGRTIAGHATDVALRTFGALAKQTKLDASQVTIIPTPASMRELIEAMLAGKTDGVFGYVTTQTVAAMSANIDLRRLRFIKYNDYVPALYGSALMVRRSLVREEPELVRGLVRAFNRGLRDAVNDYDAAITAIARRDPKIRPDLERARLVGTLTGEMAHPEGKRLGIGDVNDKRLQQAIALLAETNHLPRVPQAREIFTRDFLPPQTERVRTLAR